MNRTRVRKAASCMTRGCNCARRGGRPSRWHRFSCQLFAWFWFRDFQTSLGTPAIDTFDQMWRESFGSTFKQPLQGPHKMVRSGARCNPPAHGVASPGGVCCEEGASSLNRCALRTDTTVVSHRGSRGGAFAVAIRNSCQDSRHIHAARDHKCCAITVTNAPTPK